MNGPGPINFPFVKTRKPGSVSNVLFWLASMCICPKDGKICPDDVCRESGFCVLTRGNAPTIEVCRDCNQLEEFCECYDGDEFDDDYCPMCHGIGEGPCVCGQSPA